MIQLPITEGREQTRPYTLRAPTGWLLEACCHLDEHHPGFLRRATESAPGWRNAVALAVAGSIVSRPHDFLSRSHPNPGDLGDPTKAVATLLLSMKPSQIVSASLGGCPDGLLGALAKLGHAEISPEALLALQAVFVDPAQARRRKVIVQLQRLDERLLQAAMILDAALISPRLVMDVRHGRGAERFNSAIGILRRHVSTATDAALASSLSNLGPDKHISEWVRSWLRRADKNFPSPPWRGGDGLIHLRDGEALRMAADRTRTCIATRVDLVLSGRAAFYLQPKQRLIACVVRTTQGWLATQVVGERNLPVPPPVRDEIMNILERNGVPIFRPIGDPDGVSAVTGSYLRGRIGEFDLDDVLDDYEFA